MVRVGTFTLSEQDYDKRDFLANNVMKVDGIITASEVMRGISETYNQGSLGSCTALGTTHSLKSQNDKEHKGKQVFVDWKNLRANMGHSITKYDGGDSVENAVKTALKKGVMGKIDGSPYLFSSDARCYGKRDIRAKALQITPLIIITNGDATTRKEMKQGEVKTIKRGKLGHCTLVVGRDRERVYFYNSRSDAKTKGGISNYSMTHANFRKAIDCGMINRRRFGLIDKKDMIDYAKEIEKSKQLIKLSKQLYEIGGKDLKKRFEEIQITDYLEKLYGFKY